MPKEWRSHISCKRTYILHVRPSVLVVVVVVVPHHFASRIQTRNRFLSCAASWTLRNLDYCLWFCCGPWQDGCFDPVTSWWEFQISGRVLRTIPTNPICVLKKLHRPQHSWATRSNTHCSRKEIIEATKTTVSWHSEIAFVAVLTEVIAISTRNHDCARLGICRKQKRGATCFVHSIPSHVLSLLLRAGDKRQPRHVSRP